MSRVISTNAENKQMLEICDVLQTINEAECIALKPSSFPCTSCSV